MQRKTKRTKNRSRARPKKQYWLQSTHQWRKDIFVSTGLSAKEMVRKVKTYKPKKYVIDFLEEREKEWHEIIEKGCAFVAMEGSHGCFFIRLREYEDTWEFWGTLVHELSHLLDMISEHQAWEKESEARAYLHEYLFQQIRRKLQGNLPYKVSE
jgi:hypothetical protein